MPLNQESESPSYWMDMLKTMSETLRIGLVVSDMFVPGCPLAHLNEGFAAQTGTHILSLCLVQKQVGAPIVKITTIQHRRV